MKQLCIVLVLILVTSLTGMAQAETRLTGTASSSLVNPFTDEVSNTTYYASFTTEYTNETVEIVIDQEAYDALMREKQAEQDHYDGLWYVQTCRWCEQAAIDAVDWITFWD